MKGLTAKQQEMLDFIEDFARREGMAPTVYEIADFFKIRSPTAFAHLRALQRKGYVARSSKARSLNLLKAAGSSRSNPGLNLSIPILGRIAAGAPLLAEEQVESSIRYDPALLPRGCGGHKIFGLKVFGDSMRDLGILDGDVVLAKQTNTASIGDVVVALVNDSETTVKTLYLRSNQVELRPANPKYKSQFYPADKVAIQGVVIALHRTF